MRQILKGQTEDVFVTHLLFVISIHVNLEICTAEIIQYLLKVNDSEISTVIFASHGCHSESAL